MTFVLKKYIHVIIYILILHTALINCLEGQLVNPLRLNESRYVLNTIENKKILNEVYDKLNIFALSHSIQDFMEKLIVLGKYKPLPIQSSHLQAIILFVLDSHDFDDLMKIKNFWIQQVEDDTLYKSRPELKEHIIMEFYNMHKFIDANFELCKFMLLKVKTKDTYYKLLNFYGINTYPNVVCLCLYLFDALKFAKNNYSEHIFAEILFKGLVQEMYYFGLPLREPLHFQIDD